MPQDNLIAMFHDPSAQAAASLAWRCVSCGRIRLYDDAVPQPAACADCGGAAFQSVQAAGAPAADAGQAASPQPPLADPAKSA